LLSQVRKGYQFPSFNLNLTQLDFNCQVKLHNASLAFEFSIDFKILLFALAYS